MALLESLITWVFFELKINNETFLRLISIVLIAIVAKNNNVYVMGMRAPFAYVVWKLINCVFMVSINTWKICPIIVLGIAESHQFRDALKFMQWGTFALGTTHYAWNAPAGEVQSNLRQALGISHRVRITVHHSERTDISGPIFMVEEFKIGKARLKLCLFWLLSSGPYFPQQPKHINSSEKQTRNIF